MDNLVLDLTLIQSENEERERRHRWNVFLQRGIPNTNLFPVEVEGIGACLFTSIGFLLTNSLDHGPIVRSTVVAFLRANTHNVRFLGLFHRHHGKGDFFSNFLDPSVAEKVEEVKQQLLSYITEMEKPTTQGSMIEVYAACVVYQREFWVYNGLYETIAMSHSFGGHGQTSHVAMSLHL